MTEQFWSALWFWWLVAVAASFLLIEAASIAEAIHAGLSPVVELTLSDCIRRWATAHHQIPALVIGGMALLAAHWFWRP